MSLLAEYNSLSAEDQASLGKTSSKLNTPGCHLVTIESMIVIEDSRVKVDFKTESGLTVDYTGFLTNKDPSKLEDTKKRVMSQLTSICNAAGLELKKVLSKSQPGTVTYSSGTKTTEEFPLVKGKKLYITTYTEVEGDDKDATKAYPKQVIDVFKFFDIKKRNGLEIQTDAAEGTTMEAADAEAKARFEINYRWTSSAACQAKLAAIQSGSTPEPTAAQQAAQEDIAEDDI